MNQSLKSKRDELANQIPKVCCDMAFKHGYDAAIQAVIELLGEFDGKTAADKTDTIILESTGSFIKGARWKHEQMLNKLRSES